MFFFTLADYFSTWGSWNREGDSPTLSHSKLIQHTEQLVSDLSSLSIVPSNYLSTLSIVKTSFELGCTHYWVRHEYKGIYLGSICFR